MRMVLGVLVLAVGVAVSVDPARAAGMQVESGQWEMTSTTTNPMTGQPQSFTAKECIEGSVDPEGFMRNTSGCEVTDVESSASSMSWTMKCSAPGGGGDMTGRAQVRASNGGKTVSGTMNMSANFGGQTMEFASKWAGHWVGPCP